MITPMELSEMHAEWGKRIRRTRREKELTATAFAREVGISRTHLYRLEKGQQAASDGVRIRIAEVLGVEPNELFDLKAAS